MTKTELTANVYKQVQAFSSHTFVIQYWGINIPPKGIYFSTVNEQRGAYVKVFSVYNFFVGRIITSTNIHFKLFYISNIVL